MEWIYQCIAEQVTLQKQLSLKVLLEELEKHLKGFFSEE